MHYILAADTSQNYVAIIIVREENISLVHKTIRNLIGFPKDRVLHLREMSSKIRRHLTNKVAKHFREIVRYIEKIVILVVIGKYKKHAHKIISLINRLAEEYKTRRTVLGSDFKYYLGKKVWSIKNIVFNDYAEEVQIADIIVNTYRRHRKEIADFLTIAIIK